MVGWSWSWGLDDGEMGDMALLLTLRPPRTVASAWLPRRIIGTRVVLEIGWGGEGRDREFEAVREAVNWGRGGVPR